LKFFRVTVVPALLTCAASVCHSQTFEIEALYGLSFGIFDTVVYQPIGGSPETFTINSPDFVEFRGVEWDALHDRVVLLAIENTEARLVCLDAVLSPSSLTVLRTGLSVDSSQVDVDPESGRIYWWESGQILSVDPDGTGAAQLEADNVAEPVAMEIDATRNRYLVLEEGQTALEVGSLGVPGPSQAIPLVSAGQINALAFDIDINQSTGELFWTEIYVAGTNGIASSVIRADNNGLNAVAVYQNTNPPTTSQDIFAGLGVIGDQLGVVSYTDTLSVSFFGVDLTSGDVSVAPSELLSSLDIAYSASPISAQPESVLVDAGDTASLSVHAFDSVSMFQWRRQGVDVANDDRVSGAMSDTLMISDAQPSDTNAYTCVVTNSDGVSEVSDAALIAVRGEPAPSCGADLNGDGELNFFDVSIFLSLYNAGCP